MCEPRTKLCKVLTEEVTENFQEQIQMFETRIPSTVKVGESIKERVKLSAEVYEKYFGGVKPADMAGIVKDALAAWFGKGGVYYFP